MNQAIKIVIALLLFLCLADMPYGFYQIVRFSATATFAYISFDYLKNKQDVKGIIFAILAVLFQPFFKIALGRTIWNAIDIIVAIGLVCLVITNLVNKKK